MSSRSVLLSAGLLAALAVGAIGDEAKWRTGAENVLVVFAANDADRDGSGSPDSAEAARYYAARRGVPEENLLGLTLKRQPGRGGEWTYPEFFEQILQPVAKKLSARPAGGTALSERVCYIVLCPGVPMTMITHPPPAKDEKSRWRITRRRSVEGYLISVDENLRAGVEADSAAPGPGASGPLGADPRELVLPIFLAYRNPAAAVHFRQLRQSRPDDFDFYLPARLGLDLASARDCLDGALYAERYLRLPEPPEQADAPAIWLDQKYDWGAHDHVAAMARAVAIAQGLPGTPFAEGKGLHRPWPLVIDNQSHEIGAMVAQQQPATRSASSNSSSAPAPQRVQHKPTVTARIAAEGVAEKSLTLTTPPRIGQREKDAPTALYFPPGCTITNGSASACVLGVDVANNRLLVDSVEGFAGGQTVRWTWPGQFPATDCFLFYGFYGLGRYEDVFEFPPGALGIHVDSACMTWARGAIGRGIAATFGVTTEPLSAGIPYGDQVLLALSGGYDWAEAAYGGLRLAQRWTGVLFGDPLYAPFRSAQLRDQTPPVLGKPVVTTVAGKVIVSVALAGTSPDELADVALFRLEYGRTQSYGQMVDFYSWPEPGNSGRVEGRRFGYSRHFRWTLTGLEAGRTCHYRLTARDPAGLTSRTPDATFTP